VAIDWGKRLKRVYERQGRDENGNSLVKKDTAMKTTCSGKDGCECGKCKTASQAPATLKPALTPSNAAPATPAADISLDSKETHKKQPAKKAYMERQGDFSPAMRPGVPAESARKEASVKRDGEYKPQRQGEFNPQLR
jgi:hypothetical protein